MTDNNDDLNIPKVGDDLSEPQPLDIDEAPELSDEQKRQYKNRYGKMNDFKDSTFGKIVWKLGDIAKGKGTAGRLLDSALEIAPIPNPIRYTQEFTKNKQLKKLQKIDAVQQSAKQHGINFDDLIDDSPNWVKPTIAVGFMVGVFVLVGLGVIDVSFLKWLAEIVIQTVIGAG